MGYTTEFYGQFDLDKPLTQAHLYYLNAFADTRRMKRNSNKLAKVPDPAREAVGLPVGIEGEYFVAGKGYAGQDRDDSILDYNCPAKTQPGLWNKWVPTEDGTGIEWSGAEKFYDYVEWLEYMVENFLKPWGYTLNGSVKWRGEDFDDMGVITVKDNLVTTKYVSFK